MKLPSKLERKRNEMAVFAVIPIDGCRTPEELQLLYFKEGFDAACEELLPMIDKLIDKNNLLNSKEKGKLEECLTSRT